MGTALAMVVFKGLTGLPKDRFVNTFHFADVPNGTGGAGTLSPAALDGIATDLISVYNGGTTPMAAYMANQISRAAGASEIRFYDVNEAKPKTTYVKTFTLAPSGFGTAASLPAEVALVASYYATRNIPQRRGRIYLGPWSTSIGGDDAGKIFRPNTGNTANIVARLAALRDRAGVEKWSVYSRPKGQTTNKDGSSNPPRDGTVRYVTHIWMDDEFDSVRARGARGSIRTRNP